MGFLRGFGEEQPTQATGEQMMKRAMVVHNGSSVSEPSSFVLCRLVNLDANVGEILRSSLLQWVGVQKNAKLYPDSRKPSVTDTNSGYEHLS